MKISYPAGADVESQLERIIAALNRIDADNLADEVDLYNVSIKAPYTVINRIRDKTGFVTPVGSIVDYAAATAPSGWLICNGASVSRYTYSDLYDVIGVTYGVPADGQHFYLPDCRGLMTIGTNGTYALATTGGAATVTLDTTMIPAHGHTQDAHTHIQDAHTHVTDADYAGTDTGNNQLMRDRLNNAQPKNTSHTTATNQNTTATNQNTGGGLAHNNLSPYISLNRIIKF